MPSKRRNVTATTAPTNHTPFRKMERLFKKELDKSQLVDFDDNSQAVLGFPGCYSFPTLPGVHLLKNHLSIETQISLAEQCLTDWSKWPNLSSTDAHFLLPTEGIWNAFCTDPDRLIEPRTFDKHEPQVGEAITVDPPTDPMHKQKSTPVSKVLNRMRWTTLGYQYNWTAKEYFLDRSPPFPEQVASCVTDILCKIEHLTGFDGKLYRAEAGIINYYHRGDSLTAHQDKSEPNPSAPLVSISIGLDAVFLIGSSSRDVKPLAILLKSGDVLVMAGPARRSFHGIPRVEPCTLSTAWDNCSEDLRKFMTDSRININVRQVN